MQAEFQANGFMFRSASRRRRRRSGSARGSHGNRPPGCAPLPAKALTSMSSVDLGRWKLVSSRFDDPELEPGIDEEIGVALELAAQRGALERAQRGRSDGKDPSRRNRLHGSCRYRIALLVHAVASTARVRTGWNVPAPTCSVELGRRAARRPPRGAAHRSAARRWAPPPHPAPGRRPSDSARRRSRRARARCRAEAGPAP